MRKLLLSVILLIAAGQFSAAQTKTIDSLAAAYKGNNEDTTLVLLLLEKSNKVLIDSHPDSGMMDIQKSLALSRKISFQRGEVKSLVAMANYFTRSGDLPGSLRIAYDVLPKAVRLHDNETIIFCYNTLGLTYGTLKDFKKSLDYLLKLKQLAEKIHSISWILIDENNICKDYMDDHRPDSALFYAKEAYNICIKNHPADQRVYPFLFRNFGTIRFEKGDNAGAIAFYKQSIQKIPAFGNHYLLSEDYRDIAEVYRKINKPDSGIYYSKKAFEEAKLEKSTELALKATDLLTSLYKSENDYQEAFNYEQIMLHARDSLFSQQKALQIQNLNISEEQRRQEIEADRIAYREKVRFYILLSALGVLALLAFIFWYNNQKRKRANELLKQRKDQIETQRNALEQTLSQLKSTQSQLIQSEKMASLGELTAGIAHEIQNPLNFINNFSEVNTELIVEMQEEIEKGNINEIKAIAGDIQENEKKINMHGKRAGAIVKGMLQHSKASSGLKEPTDINALADEFMQLAYNSLRAKDESFNSSLVVNLDASLPKANVVAQDISRVLLNLFNNAFYAVNQKMRTGVAGYKPEVRITTASENGQVIIKVYDNGNGIPDSIKDKVMQPFFTTKPAGEGTGLGLSLSYDIVVKGHGGKLEVETKEGEGSTFIIHLPLAG